MFNGFYLKVKYPWFRVTLFYVFRNFSKSINSVFSKQLDSIILVFGGRGKSNVFCTVARADLNRITIVDACKITNICGEHFRVR